MKKFNELVVDDPVWMLCASGRIYKTTVYNIKKDANENLQIFLKHPNPSGRDSLYRLAGNFGDQSEYTEYFSDLEYAKEYLMSKFSLRYSEGYLSGAQEIYDSYILNFPEDLEFPVKALHLIQHHENLL